VSAEAAAPMMRVLRLRVRGNGVLALALALGLGLIAFLTGGGVALAPNTWVEIALTLIGAALAAAVLLAGAPGPAWGGSTLLLFAAVAGLTAASIAWSVQPANSWLEANQTLSYLATFGGALALARLAPERWPALVGAVAGFATAISCYALLVKVLPATLDPIDPLGRLRAPLDYWNATGLLAALGLPACLWAGSRQGHRRALRAVCVPACTVLVTVVVLSYSRSALVGAIVGVLCFFALVPGRLRAALPLGLGLLGAAVPTLWALATHPLTHDRVPLGPRASAGHAFGIVLAGTLLATTLTGLAAARAVDRGSLSADARRWIARALVTLVALAPIGLVVAVAASPRGLTGEVSHVWRSLTNPQGGAPDRPGRLIVLSNSRPRYWSEGLAVGEHALLAGAGALGYGTARTRYTHDPLASKQAHSYLIETFADFGLLGLALNLALLVAWGLAAARTLGARERSAAARGAKAGSAPALEAGERSAASAPIPPARSAERAGMRTLLCIVVIFALQSAVDWTWFVPGVTLPALVCAGWLAGRGPLNAPIGRRSRRRSLLASPGASAALVALAAAALVCCWAIWQPLRAANADSAAISAFTSGQTNAAIADARAAAARDPLSTEPLWELAAIFAATGDPGAAHAELLHAVELQPENAQSWQQLGFYELKRRQPRAALSALGRAHSLDLSSASISNAIGQARAQLAH